MERLTFFKTSRKYLDGLTEIFTDEVISKIEDLAFELLKAWTALRYSFLTFIIKIFKII